LYIYVVYISTQYVKFCI